MSLTLYLNSQVSNSQAEKKFARSQDKARIFY